MLSMIVKIGTVISTMKTDDRQEQRAVDPLLLVAEVHEHAATIDPFIVAMISATVIATGTARWNWFAADRDAVNTNSAAPTICRCERSS